MEKSTSIIGKPVSIIGKLICLAGGCIGLAVALMSCDNRDIRRVVKELAEAPVDTTGFVQQTIHTNDFSIVEVDCFADVTYHQTPAGTPHHVRVRALSEVVEHLTIDVRDGQLDIQVSRRYRMPEKAVVVADIYAPFVSKFTLDGSKCLRLGRMDISSPLTLEIDGVGALTADTLSAPEISVELSGTSCADLRNISTGRLKALLHGAGMLTVQGECDEAFFGTAEAASADTTALKSTRGMHHLTLSK